MKDKRKKDKEKFLKTGIMSYRQKHQQFVSLTFAKNELGVDISRWENELKHCDDENTRDYLICKIEETKKLLKFADRVLAYPHHIEGLFFENEGQFFLDHNFCPYFI